MPSPPTQKYSSLKTHNPTGNPASSKYQEQEKVKNKQEGEWHEFKQQLNIGFVSMNVSSIPRIMPCPHRVCFLPTHLKDPASGGWLIPTGATTDAMSVAPIYIQGLLLFMLLCNAPCTTCRPTSRWLLATD